jgi:hypothetical protein
LPQHSRFRDLLARIDFSADREEKVKGRLLVLLGLFSLILVGTGPQPAKAQLTPGGTFTDDNESFHEPNIEALAGKARAAEINSRAL